MTLLSRLFRKAAPNVVAPVAPPVARQPTLQERIASLADASPALITALAAGREPQGTTVPAALRQAAQVRAAELIESQVLSLAALCHEMETTAELLVVGSSSSRLRQLAAEAIVDPVEIKRLLKQLRDKDKGVYKILKRKSDALLAAERKTAEIAAEIDSRAAALERHSRRTPDAEYGATLERLIVNWQALNVVADQEQGGQGVDTATEQRVQLAIQRCRAVAAAYQNERAAELARREEERAQLESHERERRAAAAEAATHAAAAAEAAAQSLREAAACRAAEEAARAAERAEADQLWRRLGALIGMAQRAVREGNTQKAARLRREIAAKWPTVPTPTAGPAVPPSLTRQLQQLDATLTELKEWKDYAVAPKRVELIAAMESLVGSDAAPQALAAEIKALQDEWRTISKGIASEGAEEWERFHRAAQAAFEPCRVYFEAQAALRQDNLHQRQLLLERLAAVEAAQAGEAPDWRLIAGVLREAPLEWRRHGPVDRDANQPLQTAFKAAIGRLQARLDAWHEQNAAEKSSLIGRARQLVNLSDGREAVEEVQRLQQRWKSVGPANREREQALWADFRGACDAVFEKRQAAHAAHMAALDAAAHAAVALCEAAERIASLAGPELLAAGNTLHELRAQFAALEELPRAEARALKQRFARALKRGEEATAQQQARDAALATKALVNAGRLVRRLERASADNASPEERDRLETAVRAVMADVARWPAGGQQLLNARVAQAGKPPAAPDAERERALRLLCIRAEILAEVESPAEDGTLRRQYQVERLVQGMGAGLQTGVADRQALLLEWCAIPGVALSLHDELEDRFLRCLAPSAVHDAATHDAATHDAATHDAATHEGTAHDDTIQNGTVS